MGTFEQAAGYLILIMIKTIRIIGLSMVLASLFIGIYKLIKPKDKSPHVFKIGLSGVALWFSAILVNSIIKYDPFFPINIEILISAIFAVIVLIYFIQSTKRKDNDAGSQ